MSTIRLYVTAPEGRRLVKYGSREMGEYFDLPEDVALDLMDQPGFSHEAPSEPGGVYADPVNTPSEEPGEKNRRSRRKGEE